MIVALCTLIAAMMTLPVAAAATSLTEQGNTVFTSATSWWHFSAHAALNPGSIHPFCSPRVQSAQDEDLPRQWQGNASLPSSISPPGGAKAARFTGREFVDLNENAGNANGDFPRFGSTWALGFWIRVAGTNRAGAVLLSCGKANGDDLIQLVFDGNNVLQAYGYNNQALVVTRALFSSKIGGAVLPMHGHWVHILLQAEASATPSIVPWVAYQNGIKIGDATAPPLAASRYECFLGGKRTSSNVFAPSWAPWFEGQVYGLAFFNDRRLTPTEIYALANGDSAVATLSRADISVPILQAGGTGSYTVAPFSGVRTLPHAGSSQITFTGSTNSYTELTALTTLPATYQSVSFGGTGLPWSLSVWFRVDDAPGARTKARTMFIIYKSAGDRLDFLVVVQSSAVPVAPGVPTTEISLQFGLNGQSVQPNILLRQESGTFAERFSVWTHLCVTQDAAGVMRAYIDGEQIFSGSVTPPVSGVRELMRLGVNSNGLNGWIGDMSGLAIWTTVALTPAQVLNLAQPQVAQVRWTQLPDSLLAGETATLRFELTRAVPAAQLQVAAAWSAGSGGGPAGIYDAPVLGDSATLHTPLLRLGGNSSSSAGMTGAITLTPHMDAASVRLSFRWSDAAGENTVQLRTPPPVCIDVFRPELADGVSSGLAVTAPDLQASADVWLEWHKQPAAIAGATFTQESHVPNTGVLTLGASSVIDLMQPSHTEDRPWTGLADPEEFSLLVWMKLPPLSTLVSRTLFRSNTTVRGDGDVAFGTNADGSLWMLVKESGKNICNFKSVTPFAESMAADEWRCVVATFGSAGCRLFLQGVLVGWASPVYPHRIDVEASERVSARLGPIGPADTELAAFGAWNRELSTQEVQLLADTLPASVAPLPSPAPFALLLDAPNADQLLPLTASSPRSVTDAATNPASTTVRVSPGPSLVDGTAVLTLDGARYVNLYAGSPSLLPSQTWFTWPALSISAWIQFTRLGVDEPIIAASVRYFEPVTATASMYLHVVRGQLQFRVQNSVLGVVCAIDATEASLLLQVDAWTHVAAVLQRVTVPDVWRCTVFVNGRIAGASRPLTTISLPSNATAPYYAGLGGTPTCAAPGPCAYPSSTLYTKANVATLHVFRRALSARDMWTLAMSPPKALQMTPPQTRSLVEQVYASSLFTLPLDVLADKTSQQRTVPVPNESQEEFAGYTRAPGTGNGVAVTNMHQFARSSQLPLFLESPALSFSIWLRPASFSHGACVFDWGRANDGGTPWTTADAVRLTFDSDSTRVGTARFTVTRCGSSPLTDCTAVCDLAASTTTAANSTDWHLFAVSLDTRGVCSLYIDGVLDAQSRPNVDATATLAVNIGPASSLRVATLSQCVKFSTSTMYKGDLAQWAYFSRALSSQEVGALWADPPVALRSSRQVSAPVAKASFVPEPTRSWQLTSLPPSSHYMTEVPAAASYGSSSGLPLLRLNSSSHYFSLSDPADLIPGQAMMPLVALPGQSMTFVVWVRWLTSAVVNTPILTCSQTSGKAHAITLGTGTVVGSYEAAHFNATGALLGVAQTGPNVFSSGGVYASLGAWSQLVAVWDVAASSTRLYHNGALQAFNTWLIPPASVPRPWCRLTAASGSSLYVADLSYYSTALSASQVLALYRSPPLGVSNLAAGPALSQLLRTAHSVWWGCPTSVSPGPSNVVCANGYADFNGNNYLQLNLATDTPSRSASLPLSAPFTPVANPAVLSPALTDGISIALWMRLSVSSGSNNDQFIFTVSSADATRYLSLRWLTDQFRLVTAGATWLSGTAGGALTAEFGSTLWTHVVLSLSRANAVTLWINGRIMVSSIFNSNPRHALLTVGMDVVWFGAAASTGTYGAVADLDSLAVFTRLLSARDVRTLGSSGGYRSGLGLTLPAASPPLPAGALTNATYVHEFQTQSGSSPQVVAGPSGQGVVSLSTDGLQLSDATLNFNPLAAAVAPAVLGGPSMRSSIAGWFQWLGFIRADGSNVHGSSLFDFSAGSAGDDALRIVLDLNVTRSVHLQVQHGSSISIDLAAPLNSARAWEWTHYAAVFDSSLSGSAGRVRLYINGALVASTTILVAMPSAVTRGSQFLGWNPRSRLRSSLSVANFAVWHSTALSESQLMGLVFAPPRSLSAGVMGSAVEQLYRSAAAYLNCSAPPVNAGWLPGAAEGSGLCAFNGGVGAQGHTLNLHSAADNPSGRLPPAVFGASAALSSGLTFSMHLNDTRAPIASGSGSTVRLLNCANAAGSEFLSLEVNGADTFTFKLTVAGTMVCTAAFPALTTFVSGAMRHVLLTIAPAADDALAIVTLSINGVSVSKVCTSYTAPALVSRTCVFGAAVTPTQPNFRGTLGAFAMWSRKLNDAEAALLLANPPAGYSGGALALNPDVSVLRSNATAQVSFAASQPLGDSLISLIDANGAGARSSSAVPDPEAVCASMSSTSPSLFQCDIPAVAPSLLEPLSHARLVLNQSVIASGSGVMLQRIPASVRMAVAAAPTPDPYILSCPAVADPWRVGSLLNRGRVDLLSTVSGHGIDLFDPASGVAGVPPLPAILTPAGSAGWTISMWLLLPQTASSEQRLLSIWDPHIMIAPLAEPTLAANYELVTYDAAVQRTCTVPVMMRGLGAWTMISVRYTAPAFSDAVASFALFQNGQLAAQAACAWPLPVARTYVGATLGGGNSFGKLSMTLSVARFTFVPTPLSDARLLQLTADVPRTLNTSSLAIDAPAFISSLHSVHSLSIRPLLLRSAGSVTVTLISPDASVALFPSTLIFRSADAQRVRIFVRSSATVALIGITTSAVGVPGLYPANSELAIPIARVTPSSDLSALFPASASPFFRLNANDLTAAQMSALGPLVRDGGHSSACAFIPLNLDAREPGAKRSAFINLTSAADPLRPWPAVLNATDAGISAALWLLLSDQPAVGSPLSIIALSTPLVDVRSRSTDDRLTLSISNSRLRLEAYVGSTLSCEAAADLSLLPVAAMAHIGVSITAGSGSVQRCRLYVQGVLAAQGCFKVSARWAAVTRDWATVGSAYASALPQRNLVGKVAMVAQWPWALSGAQMAAASTALPCTVDASLIPPPAPVSSLPFLGSSYLGRFNTSAVTYDFATRPASLPGASWSSGVAISTGMQFLDLTSPADQDPGKSVLSTVLADSSASQAFTLLAWVQISNVPAGNTTRVLDCSAAGPQSSNIMLQATALGSLSWQQYAGADLAGAVSTSDAAFSDSEWFHVAVVGGLNAMDGDVSSPPRPQLRMFVNGAETAVSEDRLGVRAVPGGNFTRCWLLNSPDVDSRATVKVAHLAFVPGVAFSAAAVAEAAASVPASVFPVTPSLQPSPFAFVQERDACSYPLLTPASTAPPAALTSFSLTLRDKAARFYSGLLTPGFDPLVYAYTAELALGSASNISSVDLRLGVLQCRSHWVTLDQQSRVEVTSARGVGALSLALTPGGHILRVQTLTVTYNISMRITSANISALSFSIGTLTQPLQTGVYMYTLSLPQGYASSLSLAVMSVGGTLIEAGMLGSSFIVLESGVMSRRLVAPIAQNLIVRITALDGTVLTYTIRLRFSGPAALVGLVSPTGTLEPAFSPTVTTYDLRVSPGTTSVQLIATQPYSSLLRATAGALWIPLVSDVPVLMSNITVGITQLRVEVGSHDGVSTRIYTLIVRSTSDADLSALSFSPGCLNSTLTPGLYNYTLRVPASYLGSVSVTPTAGVSALILVSSSSGGSSTVNVSSGATSSPISVSNNGGALTIRVTYGLFTRVYFIRLFVSDITCGPQPSSSSTAGWSMNAIPSSTGPSGPSLPPECVGVSPRWRPVVSLSGPASTTASALAAFDVCLSPNLCAPLPTDMLRTYVWRVTTTRVSTSARPGLPMPPVAQLLTSSTPSLQLSANTLTAGFVYNVSLQLTLSSATVGPTRRLLAASSEASYAASTEVDVIVSPIVAIISGQAERERDSAVAITVAAGDSYNPDSPNDVLSFAWSCSVMATGAPCGGLSFVDLGQSSVVFPANTFLANSSYRIQVNVSSVSEMKWSLAFITLKTPAVPPTLFVTLVDPVPSSMNAAEVLRLQGIGLSVDPLPAGHSIAHGWSVVGIKGGAGCAVPSLTQASNLGSPVNSGSLVLLQNLLTPNCSYEFTLRVSDSLDPNVFASTSTRIRVNALPSVSGCVVSPSTGLQWDTIFTMRCMNGTSYTGNSRLIYSFLYRNPAATAGAGAMGTFVYLAPPTSQPGASFQLPAGSLILRAVVQDSFLASLFVDVAVQVNPSPLDRLSAIIQAALTLEGMVRSGLSLEPLALVQQLATQLAPVAIDPVFADLASQKIISNLMDQFVQTLNGSLVNAVAQASSSSSSSSSGSGSSSGSAPLPQSTIAVSAQALQAVTELSVLLSPSALWFTTVLSQRVVDSAIQSSDPLDPESFRALGRTADNLMITCSQLDPLAELVHSLLHAQQSHAVAGEHLALNGSNYFAYVQRDLVSEGSSLRLPTGQEIILSPEALAYYSAQMPQRNVSNMDSSGAPAPVAIDTRVVTFGSQWARCRGNGDVLSEPSFIELTTTDGTILDVNWPGGKITFTLPLDLNRSRLLQQQSDELVAARCPDLLSANATRNASSSLLDGYNVKCSFWNVTSRNYSSQGCVTKSIAFPPDAPLRPVLTCECTHTTEFVILYQRAEAEQQAGDCGILENGYLGSRYWMGLFFVYGALCLCTLVFLLRLMVHLEWRPNWLLLAEYTVLCCLAGARGWNTYVYWRLYSSLTLYQQTVFSGIPYLFYSWCFTLVIGAWISIYTRLQAHIEHRGKSRRAAREDAMEDSHYRAVMLVLSNLAISATLVAIFKHMADSPTLDELRSWERTGVFLLCAVHVVFAGCFSVYGSKLVRALTRGQKQSNPVANKLGWIAAALSITFTASAFVLAYPAMLDTNANADRIMLYNGVYFTLDIAGIVLILVLFAKAASDALKAAKAKEMSRMTMLTESDEATAAEAEGEINAGEDDTPAAGGGRVTRVGTKVGAAGGLQRVVTVHPYAQYFDSSGATTAAMQAEQQREQEADGAAALVSTPEPPRPKPTVMLHRQPSSSSQLNLLQRSPTASGGLGSPMSAGGVSTHFASSSLPSPSQQRQRTLISRHSSQTLQAHQEEAQEEEQQQHQQHQPGTVDSPPVMQPLPGPALGALAFAPPPKKRAGVLPALGVGAPALPGPAAVEKENRRASAPKPKPKPAVRVASGLDPASPSASGSPAAAGMPVSPVGAAGPAPAPPSPPAPASAPAPAVPPPVAAVSLPPPVRAAGPLPPLSTGASSAMERMKARKRLAAAAAVSTDVDAPPSSAQHEPGPSPSAASAWGASSLADAIDDPPPILASPSRGGAATKQTHTWSTSVRVAPEPPATEE